MMEPFYKQAVHYFRKKVPSSMFDCSLNFHLRRNLTQPLNICPKLTIEKNTRIRCVICMFKRKTEDTRTTSLTSFSCLYCKLWAYFTTCSSVCIVNFEQVNADWVMIYAKIYPNASQSNISQISQENTCVGVFFF